MSRHKKIVPPVMVNTGVATVDNEIIATTPENYQQLVEKEYAPENKPQNTSRSFYGVGVIIPTINKKNVKIAFSHNVNNVYTTSDPDVAEWLVKNGYKEKV